MFAWNAAFLPAPCQPCIHVQSLFIQSFSIDIHCVHMWGCGGWPPLCNASVSI